LNLIAQLDSVFTEHKIVLSERKQMFADIGASLVKDGGATIGAMQGSS